MPIRTCLLASIFVLYTVSLRAQTSTAPPLDPMEGLPAATVTTRVPLQAEYIWTANDITVRRPDHGKFPWSRTELRTAPHFFRAHFNADTASSRSSSRINFCWKT